METYMARLLVSRLLGIHSHSLGELITHPCLSGGVSAMREGTGFVEPTIFGIWVNGRGAKAAHFLFHG